MSYSRQSMVVRGRANAGNGGYNLAYKCLHCTGFRWADTAELLGETHCLCGKKFPRAPICMPFYRKGPPSTLRGKGARQPLDAGAVHHRATAVAKAKAAPKAKAKAKAAAQERTRPWRETSSAPKQPSDGARVLRLDPKRATDEVYKIEMYAEVARHCNDTNVLQNLGQSRRMALRAKAAGLPLRQRIDHLQRRHRETTAELKQLLAAQAATEQEIGKLQDKRQEQMRAVESQKELVDDVREALESAELELPPAATPKTVGRQLQHSDLAATFKGASIPALLEALSGKYSEEFGEDIADVIGRRTMQGFDLLHSVHDELQEHRRTVKEQIEADRRTATRLHQELNMQGVQTGDKREREGPLDRNGDERMNRVDGDSDADYEQAYPPWQVATGRKKGKGRVEPSDPSPAGLRSALPIGPLATAPRAGVGGNASQARDRSPRRPSAPGTPAAASESGTLRRPPTSGTAATAMESGAVQGSGAAIESEVIPPLSQQSVTAPQPATATASVTAPRSGAAEEKEVVPPLSRASITMLEEAETPFLDSLPSTPRAAEAEEETRCQDGFQLPDSVQPMELDSAGAAPGAVGAPTPAPSTTPGTSGVTGAGSEESGARPSEAVVPPVGHTPSNQ